MQAGNRVRTEVVENRANKVVIGTSESQVLDVPYTWKVLHLAQYLCFMSLGL